MNRYKMIDLLLPLLYNNDANNSERNKPDHILSGRLLWKTIVLLSVPNAQTTSCPI